MGVESRVQTFFDVRFHPVSALCDRGKVLSFMDPPDEFVSGHVGQSEVADKEVEVFLPDDLQRVLPVERRADNETHTLKDHREYFQCVCMVVHKKDARAGEVV